MDACQARQAGKVAVQLPLELVPQYRRIEIRERLGRLDFDTKDVGSAALHELNGSIHDAFLSRAQAVVVPARSTERDADASTKQGIGVQKRRVIGVDGTPDHL